MSVIKSGACLCSTCNMLVVVSGDREGSGLS